MVKTNSAKCTRDSRNQGALAGGGGGWRKLRKQFLQLNFDRIIEA